MQQENLQDAARALAAGNLAASENICRDVLAADPGNAMAFHCLGIIAAKVGALDFSIAYFETALRLNPDDRAALTKIAQVKAAIVPPPVAGPRYLVIKSWGYGFWSDVSQVLGSLLLAEITGRTPVVHWGANSLFGDGSASDAFGRYFHPISTVSLPDLAAMENATYFPAKWNSGNLSSEDVAKWHGAGARAAALYFLHRPETIAVSDFFVGVADVAPWLPPGHSLHGKPLDEIYRHLIAKYLIVRDDVRTRCEAFFRARLADAPFAAVHLRGSDKGGEDHIAEETNQALWSCMAGINPQWRIFLLTDDENWRDRALAAYGDRIVTTDCQRTGTQTGLHYLPTTDRTRAGQEVLIDTLLASRAELFFGNGRSNVAAMIEMMKRWAPGACTLIGQSVLLERNHLVHVAQ